MTQTRKTDMLAEIKAAQAAGTMYIWYGHIEQAEPIQIDEAIRDIEQMDDDAIGGGTWGAYPVTLGQLVDDYGADGYIYEDAGQGCGYPTGGQYIACDADSYADHEDVEMVKLDKPHTSADGCECAYASEWITTGTGDNPYRFRIFF